MSTVKLSRITGDTDVILRGFKGEYVIAKRDELTALVKALGIYILL